MQSGQSDVSRPNYADLWKTLGVVVITVGIIGLVLIGKPNISEVRSDKDLIACNHNLREIAAAIGQFYRAKGKLPPPCIRDDSGNPLLSGRVLLLPYLDAQDVYNRINQRERWDSEQNRSALMSGTGLSRHFHCPADHSARDGDTSYVFVPDCGITLRKQECAGDPTPIEGLPRDETNTVIMIEVRSSGINWAEPADATADDIRQLIKEHKIASPHGCLVNLLLRDGRVLWLNTGEFKDVLDRSMNNRSDTKGTHASPSTKLSASPPSPPPPPSPSRPSASTPSHRPSTPSPSPLISPTTRLMTHSLRPLRFGTALAGSGLTTPYSVAKMR